MTRSNPSPRLGGERLGEGVHQEHDEIVTVRADLISKIFSVIPAQAGIHFASRIDPRLRGGDG